MSSWDPEQYQRFRDQRRQPFLDLLELVRPQPAMRVVDLGCGNGELTRILHRRLQARDTLGIDSSETMLPERESHSKDGLRLVRQSIEKFDAVGDYDLVFSNAALHWLGNHAELFVRLAGALTANGQLAVQMPANWEHPSHLTALQVAGEEPFRSALGGFVHPVHVMAPEAYSLLLHRLGFREQQVRIQIYGHLLDGADDVVEWVKGSLLTAYRARLSAETYDAFVDRYRSLLRSQIGDVRPYFFTFRRLLLWANRGESSSPDTVPTNPLP
jgi:trans-aconitate 2-methyltransferase